MTAKSPVVSKKTVNLGTIAIDKVFDALADACHPGVNNGVCETSDVKLEGQIVSKDSAVNIELTLGPEGDYPTWVRNGLLDALRAGVGEVAKCEDTISDPPCPNPMVFCPSTEWCFSYEMLRVAFGG